MIRLQNITLGYDKNILLENISAVMPVSKLIALVGRNSTGKSTLLRAIAGLGKTMNGSIFLNNFNITEISPQQLAKTIAFVTTERIRIANLRCKDVVALGRAPYTNWIGRMQTQDTEIVNRSLRLVGMESYADRCLTANASVL